LSKAQAAKTNAVRESASGSGGVSRSRSAQWNCDWIPSLAEPYLRGYTPEVDSGNSLSGYRFFAQPAAPASPARKTSRSSSESASAGFFIGYLRDDRGMRFLKAAPPEFLIFCFIEPLRGRLHRRLVSQPDSLMRRTAEYIRWLTHHPPRFELFADQHAALVRHIPTQQWPTGRIEHYARNFTIETLAWLVRSALIRRLPEELASPLRPASEKRAARK
jgi:hypothetical protein